MVNTEEEKTKPGSLGDLGTSHGKRVCKRRGLRDLVRELGSGQELGELAREEQDPDALETDGVPAPSPSRFYVNKTE